MSDLLTEVNDKIFCIRFNRINKHNAFDDVFLKTLQAAITAGINDPLARVILLKAEGKHFSAGADIAWMQRMATYDEAENINDAMILAEVMHTLYTSPKPTIAMVQGAAFGGGAGLVAACDVAIATQNAQFCFSEVSLGLIPAVISPYVIRAMGARTAKWLFITAEHFTAQQAQHFGLIHYTVPQEELWDFTLDYAKKMAKLAPQAISACKRLIDEVALQSLNEQLLRRTATLIAKKRVSAEGQVGLKAFLTKTTPNWN